MSFYELSLLAGLAVGFLAGGALWTAWGTAAFGWVALIYLIAAAFFYWGTGGAGEAPGVRQAQGGHMQHGTGRERQTSAGPSTAPSSSLVSSLRVALSDPALRRLAPAWLTINAVVGLWLTLAGPILASPQTLQGQYLVGRFTPTQVGGVILAYVVVLAIGVTAWGYILSYVPRVRALRIALSAMLVVCLLLFLLNSSGDWPDA